jgi:DNA-binding CsgD family transcriptional regulator
METYIAFHRRQWARAFQLHEQVVRARPPDAQLKPPGLWEAAMWMSVGHPDRALSIVDAEIVAARRDGRVGTMLMWTNMRTRALYDAGRLDEARAQADEVLELEETPVVGGMTGLLVFYSLVRGALHAGRRDVIRAHRQRIDLMIADQSGQIRRNGLWLRALVAESDSDVQEALRFADEAVTMLDQPGPAMSGLPDLVDEVILTRMAIRGGARGTAVRAVAAAERRAADNPTFPMATAAARHARGLLDADADSLRVAVELLEAGTRPLLLASAQEDLARQVHSARPREAVALLDEALRAYTAAGAEHDAARTRRRLRDLGVRRRRATPPGKALAGLSALTAAEREVVRLVTEGGTNRQVAERLFLSPHTVNTHLRNAFIKLDVRSRVELTRLVADEHGA